MNVFRTESTTLPTQLHERVIVLDALRGFALLGIMLVNFTWFTGFAVMMATDPDQVAAMGTANMDAAVSWLVTLLVDSKFWSIFALLFGLGIGMQLMRRPNLGPSQRRLAVLLAVGLLHGLLIWFGDIISLYAATAFALLLFARAPAAALWRCGLLFLALPIVQGALWLIAFGQLQHMGSPAPDLGHGPAELLPHFAEGSVGQALSANGAFFLKRWLRAFWEGRFFKLLGMFLLGYWAARKQLWLDTPSHRSLLRRIMLGGFVVGLPMNGFYAATGGGIVLPLNPSELGRVVVQCLGIPALACAYVAAFALAYHRWPRALCWQWLAPVGQMSLTNYITQSIAGVVLFYGCGLGMWGRFGITSSLLVIGVLSLWQLTSSHFWLRHHRYGPLEWCCRSLVHGNLLPLRIQTKPSPTISAVNE